MEKSIFKNSSILAKKIITKVENAKENDDKEVLVTALKQHVEKICKETFLDNNGENPSLPEWVTVAKSQMVETLLTSMEAWWKDFINHTGRVTRNKSTTTGTVNLCFIVKPVVNDVNKVVKDFLIAAEGKERDNAAKKVIKTIKVAADQASKNEVITTRVVEHQGKLTAEVYKQRFEETQKQMKLTEVSKYLGKDSD